MKACAKNIVLLGAAGYTGQLIAVLLDAHEIPVCLAGRSAEKISSLKKTLKQDHAALTIDVTKENELALLNDFDIVINCAGPYNLWGKAVVDFCRKSGKIYIDISGEQYFIHESFLHNDEAIQNGASIIHSVSFESALAEILADEFLDNKKRYREISTYYFFEKSRPSPGTRLTMQLAKNFPTFYVKDGKLKKEIPLSLQENVAFDFAPGCTKALFMPYPEILFFQKNYKADQSVSYLLLDEPAALFLQMSAQQPAQQQETILAKHQKINPKGPTAEERMQQKFILAVKAVGENGETEIHSIAGKDMYGLTAFLVVKLVRTILGGHALPKGVLTPVEAGGWENSLEELKKNGFITNYN